MGKDTADILEALDFIKEHMTTKDDLAELRLELKTNPSYSARG